MRPAGDDNWPVELGDEYSLSDVIECAPVVAAPPVSDVGRARTGGALAVPAGASRCSALGQATIHGPSVIHGREDPIPYHRLGGEATNRVWSMRPCNSSPLASRWSVYPEVLSNAGSEALAARRGCVGVAALSQEPPHNVAGVTRDARGQVRAEVLAVASPYADPAAAIAVPLIADVRLREAPSDTAGRTPGCDVDGVVAARTRDHVVYPRAVLVRRRVSRRSAYGEGDQDGEGGFQAAVCHRMTLLLCTQRVSIDSTPVRRVRHVKPWKWQRLPQPEVR
jgi:hypothetical protein